MLKKGGNAKDLFANTSRPSNSHLIDYRIYYRPMKGINLRKKVNFVRKLGKEGEFQGQPVINVVELVRNPDDPNCDVEVT